MANEYSEAAKKILPKLVSQGMISQLDSQDIISYIQYLEKQEEETNNKPFTKS